MSIPSTIIGFVVALYLTRLVICFQVLSHHSYHCTLRTTTPTTTGVFPGPMNQYKSSTISFHNSKCRDGDDDKYESMDNNRSMKNEKNNNIMTFNPIQEVMDMFSNWDDVIEDFFYKRMGNGEVFYGQRKYKPSNRPNTDGQYGGMGQTDTTRIQIAQAKKEQQQLKLMERMQRENQQQQSRNE
jgi:hypothetical protein